MRRIGQPLWRCSCILHGAGMRWLQMHPADLTLAQAGAALRAGRLTCLGLVQAHLDRIDARNPEIRAFVALCPDRAIAAAKAADDLLSQGRDLGPLHGIPFGVKDLIDIAGLPTRCGSRATQDGPAVTDAPAVAHLVQAGAIPLGKLATYEFALTGPAFDGPFPPARNPANPAHITGGSSSGSAAAVASGMVRFALGTDTGGSIRSPAAFCGVAGLKPASDTLPMSGVAPLSPTLDHLGPIAATVTEIATVMATFGPVGFAPAINGLRIGYARDWVAHDTATDPGCLSLLDACVERVAAQGAIITQITLPDYGLAEAAGAVILHAEALEHHLAGLQRAPSDYGRQARQSLAAGVGILPADVARAHAHSARLKDSINDILRSFDAIVTLTTLATAPPVSDFAQDRTVWTPMRTLPFNMTGHAALSVPIGRLRGLPVGGQVIGADTGIVCRIGMAMETP